MLRLVSDENFSGDIVRGLFRRLAKLDLVRVQDVGLTQTPDLDILEWAASQGRVLLSHDVSTVPPAAYRRVGEGKPTPGVFIVPDRMPIGQAITVNLGGSSPCWSTWKHAFFCGTSRKPVEATLMWR
jgi:hypothetical protein